MDGKANKTEGADVCAQHQWAVTQDWTAILNITSYVFYKRNNFLLLVKITSLLYNFYVI